MDSLCTHCSALFPIQQHAPPLGKATHHQTIGALIESASICALCKTIYESSSLANLRLRFRDLEGTGSNSLPIELKVLNPGHCETTGACWFVLRGKIDVKQHKFGTRFNITITTHVPESPTSSSPLWKGQDSSFEHKCAAINSWYHECVSKHPECSPLQDGYPERLIHVGTDGETPRLVNAKSGAVPKNSAYAALSHCWGGLQPLSLSENNLEELQDGISIETIPRTFLEAIQVTRQLHIPYLWIDSLCIVQDDLKDWNREAARMKHIYSSSCIVISAQDSRNPTQGCFVDDDPELFDARSEGARINTLTVLPQGWESTLHLRVYMRDMKHPQKIGVLRTRGWTLQEELLAHREVVCTRPELRWRCQHMHRTETGHEFAIEDSLHRILPGGTCQDEKWLWCDWMSDYSSRDFTFPSDRLSALVGIIHQYGQNTGNKHVLACWRETMTDDLLWIRGRHPVDSTNTLVSIPSWSWLSRAKDVDFDFWNRASFKYTPQVEDHAATIEASIDWAGEPMLSSLLSSTLVLEGPVQDMRLRVDTRALAYNPPYLNVGGEELVVGGIDDGGDPIPWRCAGQFDQEVLREDEVFTCLLMRSARIKNVKEEGNQFETKETFLILVKEPSEDEGEVFRRVGIAMIRGADTSFDKAPRKRIRLV